MSGGRLNLVSSNIGFGNTAITGNAVTMLITSNTLTWSRDNQELDTKVTGTLTSNTLVVANVLSIPGVLQANATAQTLSIQTIVSANGSAISALNASNISTGTLSNARLPANITVSSITANGAGLYDLTAWNISSGTLSNDRLPSTISVGEISANGAGLYGLNATAIATGTLQNARLPTTIAVSEISGFGAGISGLNASNITSGTLSNQRLPASIAVSNISANGSGLSGVNASNVTTGTLQNARLPADISVSNVVANLSGNAAGIFGINASNITTGTLQNARLPSSISVNDVSANLIGNASGTFGIHASNVTTGTLQNARLPSTISVSNVVGNLFGNGYGITDLDADSLRFGTVNNSLLPLTISVSNVSANLSGNASGTFGLNASNISTGTLANSRLPSDIAVSNISANLIGNASGTFGINASNISTGTLANSRLPLDINVSNVSANLSGNASGTFGLNASNVTTGTLQNARLPSSISVNEVSANLSGNASGTFGLNASNVSTGTLQNERLPADISVSNVVANLSGNAAGTFGMNASNITTGTLANARLPSTISVSNVVGNLFGNGYGITNLDADSLMYGTLDNSLLPPTIAVSNVSANLSGNGSGIFGANASNISTGILAVERGGTGVTQKTGSGNVVLSDNSVLRNLTTMDTAHILGNLRVSGNVLVDTGNVVYVNAQTILSDQMIITNEGTGPALIVRQNDDQPIFEAKDDANVTFKIYDGGFVGIAPGNSTALTTNTPPSSNTVTILGTLSAQLSANDLVTGTVHNSRLPASISVSNVSGNASAMTSLPLANTFGILDVARGGTGSTLASGTGNVVLDTNPSIRGILSADTVIADFVTANFLAGNLSATYITTGTLANARLPLDISVSNVSANLSGNASGTFGINASNVSSGTLQNARLPLNITVSNVSANLSGNAAGTFGLNASNIMTGTLQNERLPADIAVSNVSANLSGNASGTFGMNASNVSSGTLQNARLPADISVSNISANLSGNAAGTFGINASNVSSGTLQNERLPTDITVSNVSANLSGNAAGTFGMNASNVTSGTLDNARLPTSINVTEISANGAALTHLNASNVTSGTLDNSRLPTSITVSDISANLSGNASGTFGINASNITGTLDNARLPSSITVSNITANVNGNGSGLSNLNLANTYGTLDNARLPNDISVGNVTATYLFGNGVYLTGISGGGSGNGTTNASDINAGILAVEYGGTGTITKTGTGSVVLNTSPIFSGTLLAGNISANYFIGNGSLLTGVTSSNASTLTEGTLQNALLPLDISVSSVSANLNGNASGIFGINASNVTTGTLANARLPSDINVSGNLTGNYVFGNGSFLTGIITTGFSNASNINSGILDVSFGGTGVTTSTGSGNVVLSNEPTLYGNVSVIDGYLFGNGAFLTGIVTSGNGGSTSNASLLTEGTLDNARLPSSIHVSAISANGFALSEINAANIVGNIEANVNLVGTLDVENGGTGVTTSTGSGNVVLSNDPTFQGNVHVNGNLTGNYIFGNGSFLTGIVTSGSAGTSNASNIDSGILSVSYGGTGVTTSTGSGNVVLSDNPTFQGNVTSTTLRGNLEASYITGTLDNARLPANISVDHVTAQDFTGNIALSSLQFVVQSGGTFEAAPGNVDVASYGFDADTMTGMYKPLANTVGFLSGGIERAQISSNGMVVNGNIRSNAYVLGNGAYLTGIATEIAGDGSALTTLNASNVTTGTLDTARLPSTIQVSNVNANFAGNGFGLFGIPLSNTTGILEDNRLPANISGNGSGLFGILASNVLGLQDQLQNLTANSVSANFVSGNGSGLYAIPLSNTTGILEENRLPANISGNGASLTSLNASNLTTGTLDNSRLPSNITIAGNSTASYFLGNGAYLTGIVGGSNASTIETGILSVLYGGTGTTSSTGTGNVVLSDSPTLYGNVTVNGNVSATSYTGNVDIGNIEITFDSGGYFEANVGNITRPGYSFDMDTSTGFYSPQANTFAFVSGGAETAQIYPGGFTVNGAMSASSYNGNIDIGNVYLEIQDGGTFRANVGNVVQPSYAFVGDLSTGLYRPLANTLGFVSGGIEKAQVSPTGFLVNGNVSAQYYTGNGSQLTGLSTPLSISNVQITDSSWNVLDDTAISTDGGYVLVNGNGFAPGSLVSVGTDFASSTSYISGNQLKAQLPAKTSGSYTVSVTRGDTAVASLPFGITYSTSPVWSTSADLGNVSRYETFTRTLAAPSDSNVTYANTSVLPPQTTLLSNGTLSGNITSVSTDDTVYTFQIKATDLEYQDTSRTFSLQYFLDFVARKLTASDKAVNDQFGQSVSINSDATRLVVGVPNSDPGTTDAGAAYVFRRYGTTWTQEAKISASDKYLNDNFGYSVAMNSDGSRLVAGAYQADPGGTTNAGAAYIFSRNGTTWTQEAKIFAIENANENFGWSVSMNSDGSRVIVGVLYASPGGTSSAGAAYIFSRSGTSWTQEAKIFASDKAVNDYFGYAVAINSDGARVVVGAYGADPGGTSQAGAAYVFSRSGTTWTQEAKIFASDKVAGDAFGYSVSINSDGSRVIAGAIDADPGGTSSAGAAYIFSRSGTTWTQEAKIFAIDKADNDYFGSSVSMNNDGSRVVMGAYGADPGGTSGAGAAYIFSRSGTLWTQEAKIFASDKAASDIFGWSVAMNGNGLRVVVSARLSDPEGTTDAGAAYVCGYSNGTWLA